MRLLSGPVTCLAEFPPLKISHHILKLEFVVLYSFLSKCQKPEDPNRYNQVRFYFHYILTFLVSARPTFYMSTLIVAVIWSPKCGNNRNSRWLSLSLYRLFSKDEAQFVAGISLMFLLCVVPPGILFSWPKHWTRSSHTSESSSSSFCYLLFFAQCSDPFRDSSIPPSIWWSFQWEIVNRREPHCQIYCIYVHS